MPAGSRNACRIAREAVLVGVAGLILALLANAVSPRGLSLQRDYFPREAFAPLTNAPAAHPPPTETPTNAPGPSPIETRLAARGLRLIALPEAQRLFQDPRRELEQIVFVDARNDAQYQEGHIPGAYQFDHYYPDQHLPAVLPACQQAEEIVVYCTGGECEDSEFASLALANAGVPLARLSVYAGGITDWRTNGLPVEVGSRGSGVLQTAPP